MCSMCKILCAAEIIAVHIYVGEVKQTPGLQFVNHVPHKAQDWAHARLLFSVTFWT